MQTRLFPAILISVSLLGTPEPAEAYDMDCAILLCLAGGFPSSAVCAAAHAEMIRRITPWPSEPPFGVCTYAAVPAASGGPGGKADLDTSTPEYAWLHRTRILWWRGHTYQPRGEPRKWSWSIRSCDHQNTNCRFLARVVGSLTQWPENFHTENGVMAATPGSGKTWGYARRAVMMEYGDTEGAMDHTSWVRY